MSTLQRNSVIFFRLREIRVPFLSHSDKEIYEYIH